MFDLIVFGFALCVEGVDCFHRFSFATQGECSGALAAARTAESTRSWGSASFAVCVPSEAACDLSGFSLCERADLDGNGSVSFIEQSQAAADCATGEGE